MDPVWTYGQIRDPAFRKSMIPGVTQLHGKVVLELNDGKIRVGVRQAFLNLFLWQVLVDFDLPICKRHYSQYRPPNNGNIMSMLEPYYDEIMSLDFHNAKRLKISIWGVLNELYKLSSVDLLSYVASLDMEDLARIMTDPKMKEIIDTKWKITPAEGTSAIEKFIDTHNKEIMNLLGTKDGVACDALYSYQKVGQLNKFQVPQTMYAFGVRTDVDDSIVRFPVVGSAIDGLQDINEFAVESLSAKKTAFYNHEAVRKSQYFGRKQHLIASTIQRIYDGDCGSTTLIDFEVTENNYINLEGKNIVVNGQLVNLTKDTVKNYIGQTVHMRSPLTCRYRNGVCEVCGGRILDNVNRKLNIGILSAVHVIEPTTQKILSAKHLIKTSSLDYEVPEETSKVVVRSKASELRWNFPVVDNIGHLEFGIPTQCMRAAIHDVTYIRADKLPTEEAFTRMTHFILRDKSTGEITRYPLINDGQIPFLSVEMLLHFRDHYNEAVLDDDVIWLPMVGTENMPIFRTVVVNDNMLLFVESVNNFLTTSIKDYTNANEALKAFSDIVYSKVSTNLMHIEILLKSYLIEGEGNYAVPVVTDPTKVHFQTNGAILSNRYVGSKLGFEKLDEYRRSASTYLVAKAKSPLDLLIGYTDY